MNKSVQVLLQLVSVIGEAANDDVHKACKVTWAADLEFVTQFSRLGHAVMRMEVFITVVTLRRMFVFE